MARRTVNGIRFCTTSSRHSPQTFAVKRAAVAISCQHGWWTRTSRKAAGVRESGVGKMTDEVKLEGYTLGRALGEGAFAVCRIGHKDAQPDVQVLAVLERVWRCVSQR